MNKQILAKQIRILREARDNAVDGKDIMRINNTMQCKAQSLKQELANDEMNEIQQLVNNINMKFGMSI